MTTANLLEIWDRPRSNRITWGQYFFGVAESVALGADCTRRRVGALLVGPDRRIIAMGYNGAPPGDKGCLSDGACPRGRHYQAYQLAAGDPVCNCGEWWPCPEAVTPGSSYDTGKGICIALHAEQNVFIDASEKACSVKGCVMVITTDPCDACVRLMRGHQLLGVKWPGGENLFV